MIASAATGSPARLAHALYMRSVACTSLGDSVKGAQLAGEARAAADACGSPTAHAQARYALGLALESTDPDRGRRRTCSSRRRVGPRRRQPVDPGVRAHRGALAPGPPGRTARSARALRRRHRHLVPGRRLGQPVALAPPRVRHPRPAASATSARRRCTARSPRPAPPTPCPSKPPTPSTSPRSSTTCATASAQHRSPPRSAAAPRSTTPRSSTSSTSRSKRSHPRPNEQRTPVANGARMPDPACSCERISADMAWRHPTELACRTASTMSSAI